MPMMTVLYTLIWWPDVVLVDIPPNPTPPQYHAYNVVISAFEGETMV